MVSTTFSSLTSPSPFRWYFWGGLAFFLLFTLGNQGYVWEGAPLHWWTDLGWTAISLSAAVPCLLLARHKVAANPIPWWFFGSGCLFWGSGMIVWDINELYYGWITPFPSIADVGFSASTILMLLGTYWLMEDKFSAFDRWRFILDSLILINVLALGLYFFFHAPIHRSETSFLGKAAGLFYPIVPLAAAYGVWIARNMMTTGPLRDGLAWFLSGLILMAVANLGYLVPIISGGYAVGSRLDPLWFGAFVLMGLGPIRILYWEAPFTAGGRF